jgi:putative ABC transport system ATP-binding protein
MENNSFITFKNVTKTYIDGSNNQRNVLNQISASFAQGEIIAVLGKSGSGKSTLLNLISGIDNVTSGSIIFNGQEITAMSERQLTEIRRFRIGFIFQFFNLLPSLTVWENVILPLELKNTIGKENFIQAEYLLSEVEMLDRRNDFPDKLSGGEQQRVAIARAIIHNPDLILADEPTGNLDERNGKIVMELLSRLVKANQKNMILVTHSRAAAKFADKVYSILDGKLVDCKKPD